MGDVGAAAVAARMAGAGLLIPIPNSGPRPPRWPRQAGEQQLTPRPAVPRPPGPAPRPPGRWLASGPARGPAGKPSGGAETGRPGWDRTRRPARPGAIGRPVSVCLSGAGRAGRARPGRCQLGQCQLGQRQLGRCQL